MTRVDIRWDGLERKHERQYLLRWLDMYGGKNAPWEYWETDAEGGAARKEETGKAKK